MTLPRIGWIDAQHIPIYRSHPYFTDHHESTQRMAWKRRYFQPWQVFLSNIPNLKTIFSDLCKYREDMVLWLHKWEGNCGGKSTKMLNFNPKFASTDWSCGLPTLPNNYEPPSTNSNLSKTIFLNNTFLTLLNAPTLLWIPKSNLH